jgi:hypothetical protein
MMNLFTCKILISQRLIYKDLYIIDHLSMTSFQKVLTSLIQLLAMSSGRDKVRKIIIKDMQIGSVFL